MDHHDPRRTRSRGDMLAFYSQIVTEGDLCFDIGANVGDITEILVELGARVVCVEPQDTCLQHLRDRFGNNKHVIIVGKAVADSEGYSELYVCEDAPTISTMSSRWINEGRFSHDYKWTARRRVPMTTLDALILLHGLPAFCKIDVEGSEKRVLDGLSRRIPLISFEFTREFFDDAKKCMNRLSSMGSVEINCSLGESMKFLFRTWVTPNELCEALCPMENQLLWGDIYAKSV
jgi:FkbM family methyltransferase